LIKILKLHSSSSLKKRRERRLEDERKAEGLGQGKREWRDGKAARHCRKGRREQRKEKELGRKCARREERGREE
jgi:hypothetical protein